MGISRDEQKRIEHQVIAILNPLIQQGTARDSDIRAAVQQTITILIQEGFIYEPTRRAHSHENV